jgi:murein L,D-transpeptidase YcbB/YkuD
VKRLIRFAFVPLLFVTACNSNNTDAYGSHLFKASSADIQEAIGNSPSAEFYKRNQWQPVWSKGSEKVLEQALNERAKHGLDRVTFLSDIAKAYPAAKEAELTKAALAYAAALAHGATDPTKLYPIYTVAQPQPDLVAGLQQALTDGKLAEWFDGLAPHDAEYAALSKAYLTYRGQPAVQPGQPDPVRALAIALERRRWLSRTPPGNRIDVNTAAATMEFIRNGAVIDRRKVVVGQPGKETPQIEAPIVRLVANPTWTVPKSIAATELAGKGAAYLKSHNMAMKDGWIVQQSGPDNSLGLVKFDMADKFEIYLHDTPAKSLFDLDQRARSHGCVRVDDALGFADTLAQLEGVTNKWQAAREKKDETFVPLPQPLTVRMLYHPVSVDRSGSVQFGNDIYGWDDPVAKQLGFDAAPGRRVTATVDDLGP